MHAEKAFEDKEYRQNIKQACRKGTMRGAYTLMSVDLLFVETKSSAFRS